MYKIELDLKGIKKLQQALKHTPDAINHGIKSELEAVAKDFTKEAKEDAPQKTGKLRKSIKAEKVLGSASKGKLSIKVNASAKKKGFNYAYFHDVTLPSKGITAYKNPTTPGTKPGFFKDIMENEQQMKKYNNQVADAVEDELRKLGW